MISSACALFALLALQEPAPEVPAPEIVVDFVEETGDLQEVAPGSEADIPLSSFLFSDQDPWEDPRLSFSGLEFGLLLDFFAAFTEKADSDDSFNEVRIRSARFHMRAPVDENTSLWTTMDFADPGDGTEFVLREAAIRVERLPLPFWPERTSLKVGQYYADIGRWNTVLPGEFAAPQLDGFRRLYLGGNLAVRGVELHHFIPLRDLRVRWSLGFAGEMEGHDLDANEFGIPPDTTNTPFGRSGIRNWVATGRAEGIWDLSSEHSVRGGLSMLYVPGQVTYTSVPGFGIMRDETSRMTGGLDLGYRWQPSEHRAHEVALELWLDDRDYRVGSPSVLVGEEERGETLTYEYTHDRNWSFGGLFSRFDEPTPGTEVDGHYHSIWSSYRLSSGNRFTLFLTHTNPAPGEQKWYTVGGQWTIEVGARREDSRRTWN